jgi:hypothetical protein
MAETEIKESEDNFDETPAGWARRWGMELRAAKANLEKFHKEGEKAVKRYLDERGSFQANVRRLNLFHADTEIKRAMLFGKIPSVTVQRRYSDANDDVARVSAEMQERLLNNDIERDSDSTTQAARNALMDWLLPGLGVVRLRYVVETELATVEPQVDELGNVLAEGYEEERKTFEDAQLDYVNWRDVLWSVCRTWDENRWIGFASDLTRTALVKRFGDKVGRAVPLNADKKQNGIGKADPWGRARVWEIWSKEHKKVFWYVEGYPVILDEKDDPLGLEGFWPCPQPLMANVTTEALIPRPDYSVAKGLYGACDDLYNRICLLEDTISVRGVYNAASKEIKRLLTDTAQNEMIAASNWPAFQQNQGLRGQVDFLPLDMITGALQVLTEKLQEKIALIHQVTGMADIMRGAAIDQQGTATEAKVKARFASIRMQDRQDTFAGFLSDAQRKKAEIISEHFDPETIVQRSNILMTPDAEYAGPALEMIKSQFACYRIQVKPEQISMTDYAQLKSERLEAIQALPALFQSMAPLAQAVPGSTTLLFEFVKYAFAGLRGGSGMESILDRVIAGEEQRQAAVKAQPPQPPPPDPKIVAAQMKMQGEQMKGQMEMQKLQLGHQADLARIAAETQGKAQEQQAEAFWNTQEELQKARIRAQYDSIGGTNGV